MKGRNLRGKGQNPKTTDFPPVVPINIIRSPSNLYGFPKFTVMKVRNLCNDLHLLNAYMMIGLHSMLC